MRRQDGHRRRERERAVLPVRVAHEARHLRQRVSVRENVIRASLLDELRHRLASPDGIAHTRKRIAERLGEVERERDTKRAERRAHLEKLEGQINQLVDFIAEGHAKGDRAKTIAEKLSRLEGEAESGRRALAALTRTGAPVKLPSGEEMLALVLT
ncbi:hypothetical protein LZC94_09930 [Pendulispora albinea]|uniref:Uncharacterized protein n=1 Tax=Pendulispora albinea TaxID=2741071 RepID=A0ABZ2M5Z5_9BACT